MEYKLQKVANICCLHNCISKIRLQKFLRGVHWWSLLFFGTAIAAFVAIRQNPMIVWLIKKSDVPCNFCTIKISYVSIFATDSVQEYVTALIVMGFNSCVNLATYFWHISPDWCLFFVCSSDVWACGYWIFMT